MYTFRGGRQDILNPCSSWAGETILGLMCSTNPEPLVLLRTPGLTQANSQNWDRIKRFRGLNPPSLQSRNSFSSIKSLTFGLCLKTSSAETWLCVWDRLPCGRAPRKASQGLFILIWYWLPPFSFLREVLILPFKDTQPPCAEVVNWTESKVKRVWISNITAELCVFFDQL